MFTSIHVSVALLCGISGTHQAVADRSLFLRKFGACGQVWTMSSSSYRFATSQYAHDSVAFFISIASFVSGILADPMYKRIGVVPGKSFMS